MLNYLIRRVLLIVPTLIGATMLIFFIMALSPVSVTTSLLSQEGNMRPGERQTRVAYLNKRYGLNKPLIVQYGRWLNGILPVGFYEIPREFTIMLGESVSPDAVVEAKSDGVLAGRLMEKGADNKLVPIGNQEIGLDSVKDPKSKTLKARTDAGGFFHLSGAVVGAYILTPDFPMGFGFKWPNLGNSFVKSRSVGPIIRESLPVTLLLQAISLPLSYVIAIVAGVWMARHRGKTQDVVTGTGLLALWSFPVILAAVMLIGYFANINYFKWFPAGELHSPRADEMRFLPSGAGPGYLLDTLWHLVLPVICLTYSNFAFISKLTRASLLEALTQDFVRTARAKGLPERVVLIRHALRNSLLPLITVLAHILPGLISGTIIIETVFSIPGMGQLVIESLLSQDRELFLSVSVMTLMLQLVGFLVSDILYAIADPRISYE